MNFRATKRDVAVILFRFLSIYSFVEATAFLSDKFAGFFNGENYTIENLIQMVGPSVLLVICGAIIWYVSPMIASRTLKPSEEGKECGLSLNDVHDLAFSAIGLFIVVNTIPDIIYTIGFYYTVASHSRAEEGLLFATKKAYLVGLGIKLLLGISLLVGSRRVAKIVRAIRRD